MIKIKTLVRIINIMVLSSIALSTHSSIYTKVSTQYVQTNIVKQIQDKNNAMTPSPKTPTAIPLPAPLPTPSIDSNSSNTSKAR